MIQITVSGNLGRDAETKRVGDGTVTEFAVACTSGRDKETVWFDVAIWGRRGEALAQYLQKGTPVTVIGEMTLRESGGKVYHKIRCHDIALQGGRRDSAPQSQGGGGFSDDSIPF
jgi:single-strand DNA-binding protein